MTIMNMTGGGAPELQSKTVVPSSITRSITADEGYDGLSKVEIVGDSNLVPGNIMSGVNIFGVVGTFGW